jgi:hypothetical protein
MSGEDDMMSGTSTNVGVGRCMMCGEDSIQQQKARDQFIPHPNPLGAGYVECNRCKRKACRKCINGWLDRITNCTVISEDAMENDVTIKTIRKMAIIINNPPYHRTIDIGTCCCFKQSIDKYATKTITKVPMPPTPKQMKGIKIRSSNIHKEYLDALLPGFR